jgi:putative membrane protein
LKLLIKWIVLTASILIVSYLLDGIQVDNFLTALLAAAALGILNAILRPLLLILTLPINVLTFGIFTFIINAGLLMLVSELIPGFHVSGFWTAIFGSILISITSGLLNLLLRDNRPPKPPPSPTGVIDLNENEKGRWE